MKLNRLSVKTLCLLIGAGDALSHAPAYWPVLCSDRQQNDIAVRSWTDSLCAHRAGFPCAAVREKAILVYK